MGSTLLVWFRSRNNALVIQEFMPESGIQQMQGRVLHTTIVPVNRQPVFECFRTCQCLVIVWIGFLIMTLAYTTEAGSACFEMVEKSSILRFLYETNPLLIRLLKF